MSEQYLWLPYRKFQRGKRKGKYDKILGVNKFRTWEFVNAKKRWYRYVWEEIHRQGIKRVDYAMITFDIREQYENRDEDNVEAGVKKVLLDALVKHKILPDDNRKHVKKSRAILSIDKPNPGVMVVITEVE